MNFTQRYFDGEASSDRQLSTTSSAPLGSDESGLVCGHVSMIGRRREMEDTVTMMVDAKYSFFAVYDGHDGAKVAEECRDKMHKFVAENVEKERKSSKGDFIDWIKVMVESFLCMDAEINLGLKLNRVQTKEMTAESKSTVGSTATVVLVGEEEIVVANCGDSRAVLIRGGAVVPLSQDHKPNREDERERIEGAGGMVINWKGCWRVQGHLSTSRSLGTDGLFDVVCNEFVCDFAKQRLSGQLKRKKAKEEKRVSATAFMLAKVAIDKGSNDNISVIIVKMK